MVNSVQLPVLKHAGNPLRHPRGITAVINPHPLCLQNVPEAVHIVRMLHRHRFSPKTARVLRKFLVIIVKFILDAHKPQKLHHGGPGVDNADFPSQNTVIVRNQGPKASHMVCVKMGQQHIYLPVFPEIAALHQKLIYCLAAVHQEQASVHLKPGRCISHCRIKGAAASEKMQFHNTSPLITGFITLITL